MNRPLCHTHANASITTLIERSSCDHPIFPYLCFETQFAMTNRPRISKQKLPGETSYQSKGVFNPWNCHQMGVMASLTACLKDEVPGRQKWRSTTMSIHLKSAHWSIRIEPVASITLNFFFFERNSCIFQIPHLPHS